MATKKSRKKDPSLRPNDEPEELLKDILIVQLFQAGVKYEEIRVIAACSGNRVSRITKAIKDGRKV